MVMDEDIYTTTVFIRKCGKQKSLSDLIHVPNFHLNSHGNGTNKLIWTVPIVMILMMKYSYDIEMGSYGDPVDVLTKDKWLILLSFFYIVFLLGLIYL